MKDVGEKLQTLVLEFKNSLSYNHPLNARNKIKELLCYLKEYSEGANTSEESRVVRGLALYYLKEIYSLAFIADAVDTSETDPDDKVNEALLADVRRSWHGLIKPAYCIKQPFCNDHYTHKFVDEWYAERRYAIGMYGSIVVQLPSVGGKEKKGPNWLHKLVSCCFANGVIVDGAILLLFLAGWWLQLRGWQRSGWIYPAALVAGIIIWAILLITRGAHVLKAVVPRLAACAIVGFMAPLATKDIWTFSFRLWEHQVGFWALVGALILAAYLYLFIETYNHINKLRLSLWRAFHILLRLCNFALFISWWSTSFISTIARSLVIDAQEGLAYFPFFSTVMIIPLPTCLLFAAFAVFIGIFLQILWHERPITSKL